MADVSLRPGSVIDDRFSLKRQLGAGGCGAVWLASDLAAGSEDVVLKILHAHFDRFSIGVRQLEREAELLRQLAHPNIAKPLLFSATGQHTYLAMELIDGRSLDQEIGAHTRLEQHFPRTEVLRIFEEICSAVGHAHSKTIIHRDLKPQNVMVSRRDGQIFVKVLDFGIAKLLEGNIFDATTFGRRLGSMFYMSPEQCQGEPADARSDIFSLGAILFEIITLHRAWVWDTEGRPLRAFDAPLPADGANALSAVLLRVSGGKRPKMTDFRPDLPLVFDALIQRAMAIDPRERFSDVASFLAELRHAYLAHDDRPPGEKRTKPTTTGDVLLTRGATAAFAGDRTTMDRPGSAKRLEQRDREDSEDAATAIVRDANGNASAAALAERESGDPLELSARRGAAPVSSFDISTPPRPITLPLDVPFNRVRAKLARGDEGAPLGGRASAEDAAGSGRARGSRDARDSARLVDSATVVVNASDLDDTRISPDVAGTALEGSLTQVHDRGTERASASRSEPGIALDDSSGTRVDVDVQETRIQPLSREHTPARAFSPSRSGPDETIAESPPSRSPRRQRSTGSRPGAVFGRELLALSVLGMIIAFLIGILIARWAAEGVQQSSAKPRLSGVQGLSPQQARNAVIASRYAHLDSLFIRLKEQPKDAQRMRELRDAILREAAKLEDGAERAAVERAAAANASTGDVEGMSSCIELLRKIAASAP